MWNLAKALLGSKKFVAAIVGVACGAAAKFGWNWDPGEILAVVSPLLAYIGAQGVADAGKGKMLADKSA
jgi:hypothetical protein